MRLLIYLAARLCEARAQRALARYFALKARAEEFFLRLDGGER
jgi:hypothetical protein